MEVSIIITNYNYGKYLKFCLESCFNQSFSNKKYEVILIDDCSDDNSVQIAKKYIKKKNFTLIKNKRNIGVAASSNIGILHSKGNFFVRVDSDDHIEKDFVKLLYNYLIKKPKILGVVCDYYHFDNRGNKIDLIKYKKKPISCGIMYNKKKLLNLGLYNNKFKHREEEELRKRLGKYYILDNLKIPLYNYRMHSKNKTKKKSLMESYRVKLSKLYNKNSKLIVR